jgi:hypothetical protein
MAGSCSGVVQLQESSELASPALTVCSCPSAEPAAAATAVGGFHVISSATVDRGLQRGEPGWPAAGH